MPAANQPADDLGPMTTRSGRRLEGYEPSHRRPASPAKRRQDSPAKPRALQASSTLMEITESETGMGKHIRWIREAEQQHRTHPTAPALQATPIPQTAALGSSNLGPAYITPPPWIPKSPPRLEKRNRVGNPGIFGLAETQYLLEMNASAPDIGGDLDAGAYARLQNALSGAPGTPPRAKQRVRVGETGTLIIENRTPSPQRFPPLFGHQGVALASPFHSPTQRTASRTPRRLGPNGTHLIVDD